MRKTAAALGGATFGVVEWFRPGEHARVEKAVEDLGHLGIGHLRTGLSWADFSTLEGPAWYDWLLPKLAGTLEVLPCITATPPSLGVRPFSSAPPREPRRYADFIDAVITRYPGAFEHVELWNEPNNINDWDWRLDPGWHVFSEMVGAAAYWVKQRGLKTVLGGMCPTDPNWLDLMGQRGLLPYIDVVGVHGFPGTWQHEDRSWQSVIDELRLVLERHLQRQPEIWLTEVGYSTWRHDEARQVDCLLDALSAPVERAYLYSYQDLAPELASQEGFHVDERHYHFGIVTPRGTPKLLHRLLAKGGVDAARELNILENAPAIRRDRSAYTLITGGAGFIGSNLAERLAQRGEEVVVYDNLSRPGVEENLQRLKERHGDAVTVVIGDMRDAYGLRPVVAGARQVFHLAAQVAVTTSLLDPLADFEINLKGTFNLLEAIRAQARPVPLLFTSTNKVYGSLDDIGLGRSGARHAPLDPLVAATGVSEAQPLMFYSPYGCSKGGADQYVLDYARIYGLPAAVFRMSCIYGPWQRGNEDQGWIAHFLIRALAGQPITIFGDGYQVRDVLFASDLVDAFLLAQQHMGELAGQAFNIGGGAGNAVSLREALAAIGQLLGREPDIRLAAARPGDQLWYVSDTRRFGAATGWRPRVALDQGLRHLARWLEVERPAAPALAAMPDAPLLVASA
jgi:CDP-paratose 2-epimerase